MHFTITLILIGTKANGTKTKEKSFKKDEIPLKLHVLHVNTRWLLQYLSEVLFGSFKLSFFRLQEHISERKSCRRHRVNITNNLKCPSNQNILYVKHFCSVVWVPACQWNSYTVAPNITLDIIMLKIRFQMQRVEHSSAAGACPIIEPALNLPRGMVVKISFHG